MKNKLGFGVVFGSQKRRKIEKNMLKSMCFFYFDLFSLFFDFYRFSDIQNGPQIYKFWDPKMDPNCAETHQKRVSAKRPSIERRKTHKKAATGHAFSTRQISKSMKKPWFSHRFCMLHLLPRSCSMCFDTFKNCPQIIPQTVPKRSKNVFKRRFQ